MTAEALAVSRPYLLEFGSHSNAYFHCQEGFRRFLLPGTGLVSFHERRGLWGGSVPMVFVNPLCAEGDLPVLLGAFLERHGPAAVFMGVAGATARALGDQGFTVNEFGVEYGLPVGTYAIRGREMRHLRYVRNHGARGVTVRELDPGREPWEEARALSARWLKEKRVAGRELRFLTRPPSFDEAWGVRRFYCFLDGRLVGFVFFDPFFRAGRCIGYCANILRSEPGLRPHGVLDFAILTALERFREEGLEELALGICPLHGLERCPGEDPLLRLCGRALYRYGGFLYNFRELAFHKGLFLGEARKVYFCTRGLGRLTTLALSLRATNLL